MSANSIERKDASETARRLAGTAHNASSTSSSPSDQKCVDPRDERAVAEHAMEQWIESASSLPAHPSTPSTHSGMPYARLVPDRAVQGAHGGGHRQETAPAEAEPAPVNGVSEELASFAAWHLAGLIAPAPVALLYLATHAPSHDGEGAEAIMHAATMVHPH